MAKPETTAELCALLHEIVDDGDTSVTYGNRICRAIALIEAAEERALAAEAERDALREALSDAAEAIEHWGAYASSYLQEKHDWAGDIARARAVTEKNNDDG